MTITETSAATKVAMLKHLVAGHDLDFVAAATHIPRDKVLDVVSNHGYPDHDRMGWAVDMLIQGRDSIPERPTASLPTGTPPARPTPPLQRVQGTPSRPRVLVNETARGGFDVNPAPARPVHTSTAELLHQAGESDLARTRNLGAKISTLLADLTLRLADEQEAHEAKVAAEKAAAAVATRIATLQAAAWAQVRDTPHLSYRQFDYWTDKNYIGASYAPGTGNPRTFPPGEVAVVQVMAALVHAGLKLAAAASVARQLATGGVGTLGGFQVTAGEGVGR